MKVEFKVEDESQNQNKPQSQQPGLLFTGETNTRLYKLLSSQWTLFDHYNFVQPSVLLQTDGDFIKSGLKHTEMILANSRVCVWRRLKYLSANIKVAITVYSDNLEADASLKPGGK